jgi:transcriptional regulator with XRE-family HTH domain
METMADSASEAGQSMNLLQRLIGERLLERGWSYGDVARRGGLPRSTLYSLATTRDLASSPRAAIIDALARGLEVPAALVRAIADESAGALAAE